MTSGARGCVSTNKQESYKAMAADTGDLENEGEMGGLSSKSAAKGQAPVLECPSIALDLTEPTFLRIPDVMSWSQCGKICESTPETVCQYWTWEKSAHTCHVKKDMGATVPDRVDMTSGARGCVSTNKQESYKTMAADTGDLENEGEIGGLIIEIC